MIHSIRQLPACALFLMASALALLISDTALAQTVARPDRGLMPGASYSVSDTENISLTNGNLNLTIPLASLPPIAGGKLKFGLNAIYNSKLWNLTQTQQQLGALDGCGSWVVSTPQLSDAGGWRIGAGYQLVFREASEDFNYFRPQPYPPEDPCGISLQDQVLLQDRWYRVVLITPDGAEHELRPTDAYQPYPGSDSSFLFNYYRHTPDIIGQPMRYYSFDGSYMWAVINPSSSAIRWTVYLNDGTRIIQSNDGTQRMQDTNGNSVKTYYDTEGAHFQDEQTGREIKVTYDPSGNGGQGQGHVLYQTVGGAWHSVDINYGTTRVQGKVYQVEAWSYTGGETGGGMVCHHNQELATDIQVIREIVYPATEPGVASRRFTFVYNSDTTESATDQVHWACGMPIESYTRQASKGMGDLSQMTTPTGAVVNYRYSRDSTHYFLFNPDDIPRETITQKSMTHDGVTDVWNYSIVEFNACAGTVTAPDGSTTTEACFPRDAGAGAYFTSVPKAGLPFRTNNADKMLVERHWALLKFNGVNGNATGNYGETTVNPVVDAEYTSLLDDTPGHNPIKMSAKTYQYDYNGNLLSETDYDWFDPTGIPRDGEGVPTGVPAGATVLRTVTNSYYNPADTSTSGNVYAKRNLSTGLPLILTALQQTASGPSVVQLSYDGLSYGTPPTAGNLTSKSLWDDFDSKWITTSTSYNSYGNAISTTDGRGKLANFYYDDLTHATPTRVVVDPQNGTGTQTTTIAFDFYTGLPTGTTDVNGQTTTIDYTNQLLGSNIKDPFGRPGLSIGPYVNVNGTNQRLSTVTKYFDSSRMVRTVTDLNAEGDGLLRTETLNDELGRTSEARQYETASAFIAFRQTYDDVNRTYKTSNPFRVINGVVAENILWTTSVTDALGRLTSVTTPDSAVVSTSYDANFTTAIEQTGKLRRSKVDGLGRVVRLDEPNGNNSLGTTDAPVQPTSYDYDVLGNLRHVYQGSQTRTFTYDSLSRLRSAANPENGTISLTYDDDNNVLVRTDARGVSAHNAYDALNRIIRRWYNGSSAVTSILHNTPALPVGVSATDEATYVYDTLAGNGKGRLTSVSTSTSSYSYSAYDAMGRVSGGIQTIFGQTNQTYTTGYTYDLAGHLKTITYPSQRTLTNTYDDVGRLVSVSGSLGGGAPRTYTSGIIYDASSRMTKEQFGTTIPIYNKLFYNSRGQLAEICEGTTYTGSGDTGWERGAIINHYSNGCWGMCGGSTSSTSMTDNNGNLKRQEHWIQDGSGNVTAIFTQQYEYDSLNRLQRVADSLGSPSWQQRYIYDRYGNRTIDQDPSKTFGAGIPKPNFTVDTSNNRLGVPNGPPGTMSYDFAGNLITDTYSALAMTRAYDAENRMTSETQANNYVAGVYSYDTDGRRVKRKVNGAETWQVYGVGGELIAEYAANTSATSPQKEYGYRNGQILITAAFTAGSGGSAFTFTDDPVVSGTTTVKATHLNELRTAVNQTRAHANLSAANWAEVIATGATTVKASHITELRARLDEARAALGLSVASYTDPNLASGNTIKAAHIQELRTRTNEALTAGGASTLDLRWLVSDQLGTPRMIFDLSGSLVNTSRHDYLPFGEELIGGNRSAGLGYVNSDGERQKFTSKERDNETGLDYFGARYFSSTQGRFTSADPRYFQSEMILDPQRFDLYGYARNNPLKWIDPNGERVKVAKGSSLDEIYALVGGKEIFEQYFQIQDGEITLRDGVDSSKANLGVQFLVELINRPQTFLVYLGADADSVARMFAGTVGKDGKLNSEGKRIATIFKNDGYLVTTAGRPGVNGQPSGDVFTVLAIDPKTFSRTQTGDAGIAEFAAGIGQKVTAINVMMHELAENLNFSIQGTHTGPIPNKKDKEFKGKAGRKLYDDLMNLARGGFDYYRAHGFAQQYEIDLRNDLRNVSGGFAGGVLDRNK